MSAKRTVPTAPKLRAERAKRLVDLRVRPYGLDIKLGLRGTLTESEPSVPEWMEKRKRGRAPRYDEAADNENVNAGLESEVETV
jgi:hypothetical protein